ncbi:MAG: UDP-glucose/GDP-mannose dehydrogenase family protein [Gammaproteobacteria bacterium]|nr:UDP-glucose/GDP-mannose dehydrogenase family protein [Gammaproteobacteria bacterium]
MKITIYGSGYVGLVSGACLAQVGNQVLCVDIDSKKIDMLKDGQIPIHEPGLDDMIQSNIAAGRIQFTTDPAEGVAHGLFQFIAVGTPPDEDGSADLSYVLNVAETIAEHMQDYRLIVNKSTVPVGTADLVRQSIKRKCAELNKEAAFDIASNPEFLKEGAAIEDFMKPDRVVVGTDSDKASELMRSLYQPFNRNRDRINVMDIRSAELTKYAANAMLATKISFINELANLAERVGADIEQVRLGIGSDPRIGYNFIYPGCGYGGSCFPKDVQALQKIGLQADYETTLIAAVDAVNQAQKEVLFSKIKTYFNNDLGGKTFALWGLAFKPNTDDMREASSRTLMQNLWAAGAKVQAYDPVAMDECKRIYGQHDELSLCNNAEQALQGADALIIVTEWTEFRSPNFMTLKATLQNPLIFDGRNLYDPADLEAQGIEYYAIGRGRSIQKFDN